VAPSDANYYTEPRDTTHITILEERASAPLGPTTATFGGVVVSNQVLGYRCKQLYKDTVLDIVDLELPEQVFETEAFWFTVPAPLVAEIARLGMDLGGAIHAAEHACIGMMPLLAGCDRWDIGGVSYPHYPGTGMATVFIYDGHPGGVGIAEATYHRLAELFRTTQQMIAECPCEDGCPSCVQSPKCGNNNEPLDKRGAAWLLEQLLCVPAAPAGVAIART
jgi:DEAD/DEAH box helicase domain-containing protein